LRRNLDPALDLDLEGQDTSVRMSAIKAIAALAAALVSACGSDEEPRFEPLHVRDGQFVDSDGRAVLLRGVNARVDGVFDVTFDDGRIALEDIPALTGADCQRMRELGFNVLRLPVNWSGIEPERDVFDEAYLEKVDAAVDCAGDAGVFVLLDMHQDAYSKHIGEDGAPLWAIVPEPEMLLEGPLEDLEARRTSRQVTEAFESFFTAGDPHGLQAEFIDAFAHLAARYAEHPMVIGFEIFNEPQAPAAELNEFQFAAAERIRQVAPRKLVFFEPPVIRNFTDFQPLSSEPFPVPGAVYAPHVYTLAFRDPNDELATLDKERLRASLENARAEANAWDTPLFVGEFGIGPEQTNFDLYLRYQYELQDEYLASSAFWLWKEDSQGRWGLYDFDETAGWSERPEMVAAVSRPYVERFGGAPQGARWVPEEGVLELSYGAATEAPSVVFVPERFAVSGVTCDGASIEVASTERWLSVPCGGPGDHTVRVELE
jgi:endoglycosylceramidase